MSMFSIVPNAMFRRNPQYNPRNDSIMKIHDDIDALFDSAFKDFFGPFRLGQMTDAFTPCLEVRTKDDRYSAQLELPGVDPDDVSITLQDRTLLVKGEKRSESRKEEDGRWHSECSYGSFERSMTLPEDADLDNVTARAANGVLSIDVPRKAPAAPESARRIAIAKA